VRPDQNLRAAGGDVGCGVGHGEIAVLVILRHAVEVALLTEHLAAEEDMAAAVREAGAGSQRELCSAGRRTAGTRCTGSQPLFPVNFLLRMKLTTPPTAPEP